MSATTDMRIEGEKDLVKALNKLDERTLLKVGKGGMRTAARPVVRMAKRLVPVRSGRLRTSLAVKITVGDHALLAWIGPRRDFRYTGTDKVKRVSGYGKQKKRAMKKGAVHDNVNPILYASGIEYGKQSNGRIARKRGGVHFLERALNANKNTASGHLASGLRKYLAKI